MIRCDFCPGQVQADEDYLVVAARPADRVMCAQCRRRVAALMVFLVELEEQELIDAEPGTRLIC